MIKVNEIKSPQELHDALILQGKNNFCIKPYKWCLKQNDVEVLDQNQDGNWEVYYTERGRKKSPIFSSQDKSEAFRFYYNHSMRIRGTHCVVHTRQKEIADRAVECLSGENIEFSRHSYPHSSENDLAYAVLVFDKDILKMKSLSIELPIIDDGFFRAKFLELYDEVYKRSKLNKSGSFQ